MVISKITKYWMKYGTLRLLKKSLAFLFSYVPLNFYCISSLPPKKIQSKCPLHIRKGSIDDFQQIADFLENDDPEQVKLLFNKDRESFLAFSGNMLVHTATLCHLKKDEVRICYCETRSNFRGMNIYPTILQYLINYSFTHGKKKCFIDAAPSNKASIRGIEKAGFALGGQRRRFKVLGKIFTFSQPSARMSLS